MSQTRTLIGVSAMAACLLSGACGLSKAYIIAQSEEPIGQYRLELLNNADDNVRVQVAMWAQFRWNTEEGLRYTDNSGIIDLSSGEKNTFSMVEGFGGSGRENNRLVSGFSAIRFYDKESVVPYASYAYQGTYGCGEGTDCADLDGDELDRALIHFRSTDGQEERLFVRDPDRPFYLERDREDRGLGRIVITFVPAEDADAGRQE